MNLTCVCVLQRVNAKLETDIARLIERGHQRFDFGKQRFVRHDKQALRAVVCGNVELPAPPAAASAVLRVGGLDRLSQFAGFGVLHLNETKGHLFGGVAFKFLDGFGNRFLQVLRG